MDSDILGIFIGDIIVSFFIALSGRNREIGFLLSFVVCLILSPIIGLAITLCSKEKDIRVSDGITFIPMTPEQMKSTPESPKPEDIAIGNVSSSTESIKEGDVNLPQEPNNTEDNNDNGHGSIIMRIVFVLIILLFIGVIVSAYFKS